jgi:HSP20 family protein
MFYRRSARPTFWDDMERLRRQLDRVVDGPNPRTMAAPSYPALNVWTNEDGALVTAELPGLEPKDLDINVVGKNLTISGSLTAEVETDELHYHRQERGTGKFVRTIELPYSVDPVKVEARMEKGVLMVSLPRAEEEKPKKIMIKSL